ncbi:MAG: hypothetical protein A2939_04290 [Parcubacteria group bacterium RIFCSPLOWO2_01_FULL_48_18]|nr:MAG: hypothetical protein A2939_04290 [Parcubacteria group bacterium RIFCSPLOWO2_01_FULL_48_18]
MNMPSIVKNRNLLVIFSIAFVLWCIAAGLAFFNFSSIASPLIIHFDVYRGLDFLGSRGHIFNIIIIAFVLLVTDCLLASVLLETEKILSYYIGFFSMFINAVVLMVILVLMNFNL